MIQYQQLGKCLHLLKGSPTPALHPARASQAAWASVAAAFAPLAALLPIPAWRNQWECHQAIISKINIYI